MTSAPTAASTTTTGTYHCDACGMETNTTTSTSLHSPHCHHHPSPSPRSSPNPNPNPNPLPTNPTAYLPLLIHHLSSAAAALPLPRGPSPTAAAAIAALPHVPISDPSLFCAICKDEFAVGFSALQLPCSHVYHSDCIVPWLHSHNSCPLCRFRLPNPSPGDDLAGIGGRIARGIARRQRIRVFLRGRMESHMLDVDGDAGPAYSEETVSSESAAAERGQMSGARERMEE